MITPFESDKSDWTAKEALTFYAEGQHFDTIRVDGDPEGVMRTRIIDTGAVASNALKGMDSDYADKKGVACDSEQPEPDIVAQTELIETLGGHACKWERQIDRHGELSPWWKTGCGESWRLNPWDTNPSKAGFNFCPKCGRKV